MLDVTLCYVILAYVHDCHDSAVRCLRWFCAKLCWSC